GNICAMQPNQVGTLQRCCCTHTYTLFSESLAHPCSYFCGQYAGMIQATANVKDILH
ncbi:unnamed protein product, partial [Bubo scandiacus]